MIRLALSADAKAHPYHATLLASILRRTASPVHVRCWCRGFLPESFETGPLKVEFIEAGDQVIGKVPGYVGPAVFDRLQVIRDSLDWDTCLVMDYDQLALCDLAPLFETDLGGNLLAARMQAPGIDMAYAMRTWIKRPFPQGWEHVASHPYFSMGPLLNLCEMRIAGTWEKLVAAQAAFGADENLALVAATEGRTTGFARKWNMFPISDLPDDAPPEGVVHWLGWPKPWHRNAKVWRPDIWESERTSWEHLRMGIWRKPVMIELEPEDDRSIRALAERGWKVKVFASGLATDPTNRNAAVESIFPDVEARAAAPADFQRLIAEGAGDIDCVRIGKWVEAADWLDESPAGPEYLVLKGGLSPENSDRIRALGYTAETRIMPGEWPAGGPLPRALDFHPCQPGTGIGPGEDLYLWTGGGNLRNGRLSFPKRLDQRLPTLARRVGLCVVATGSANRHIASLIRSVRRNFLPGHHVTLFLFTDRHYDSAPDVRVIRQPDVETQTASSIWHHNLLAEHSGLLTGEDFLYTLDAAMRVVGEVGEEILGELVGTLHPGFHDKTRDKFTFERRNESTAYVSPAEGKHYFCGGFQGGRTSRYLEAVRVIAGRIQKDTERGITAAWQDESHWNRYLIDHEPTLVLSPSYCWYPDGRSKDFEGKIAMGMNDAAAAQG